jgi:hypothetical protein
LKFKLDENLSPALAGAFAVAGHEAHSILEQSLGGKSDAAVIEVCARESRALVTLDLDFANIQQSARKGYITDPVGKAKQVLVTEEGARESELLLQALFGSKPD